MLTPRLGQRPPLDPQARANQIILTAVHGVTWQLVSKAVQDDDAERQLVHTLAHIVSI